MSLRSYSFRQLFTLMQGLQKAAVGPTILPARLDHTFVRCSRVDDLYLHHTWSGMRNKTRLQAYCLRWDDCQRIKIQFKLLNKILNDGFKMQVVEIN